MSSSYTPPAGTHHGRLIAILASSFPLARPTALWLYTSALEMRALGHTSMRLAGDLGEGQIRDLKQEVLLGTVGGPCFEAHLETTERTGIVRFIVTREGLAPLEADGATPPSLPRSSPLN